MQVTVVWYLQDIECCIDLIVSRSGKIALSQLLYTGVCLTKVYESTYFVGQWFVNQTWHDFMSHTQPIKEYNRTVVKSNAYADTDTISINI